MPDIHSRVHETSLFNDVAPTMPFDHFRFSVRYLAADSNRKVSNYPPSARTIHLPQSPYVNEYMTIPQNPTNKDTRTINHVPQGLLANCTFQVPKEAETNISPRASPNTPRLPHASPQSQHRNPRQRSVDCPLTLEHKTLLKHPAGVTIINVNNRAQQRANERRDHRSPRFLKMRQQVASFWVKDKQTKRGIKGGSRDYVFAVLYSVIKAIKVVKASWSIHLPSTRIPGPPFLVHKSPRPDRA
ncbi:uncharacterized protein BT62DRAFT_1012317 [Guyanagaster necrorhizus]|uniref:Uncharacterized protein n=1 Tax=Guyanagaster necrorhizus TaxID=856835 RepID=A0A9P7VHL3_9AGAR|nr:uncharacterized protein BT62DRAFT_1012317 [Guyanagaster necrorhizus MCA 3950]KAG7440723.1 hypothetical protein BT62DRAFT_1012317 [Guyanagaster necrorhizus MCA 3950]